MKPEAESRSLRLRPFVVGAVGLFLGLGIVAAVCWGLTTRWGGAPRALERIAAPPTAAGEPRLQLDPQVDGAALRAAAERELHVLRWEDDGHAFARIPIEDAMRLSVERRGK